MATSPLPEPTSDLAAALRRGLLAFFDARARDLPWRRSADPYAIWVSEVMLQQTRVETVIPYFERWLERFPDVASLAEAPEADVLKAWEGLGYYRRARNLHRAAALVRERHQGRVPATSAGLRELPGVGVYTAGAVASIAFGEAVPAVDGNVRRVLSRLFDLAAPSARELEALAAELVDPSRPGDFNQAVMELGATVCTSHDPGCARCPVSRACLALRRGTVAERPLPRRRAEAPHRVHALAVVWARGPAGAGGPVRLLVRQRPAEGLLGGLWEFPGTAAHEGADLMEVARAVASGLGVTLSSAPLTPLPEVRHAFTHLRVTYRPYLVEARSTGSREGGWVGRDELAELALPRAIQRVAAAAWEHIGRLGRVPAPIGTLPGAS
jgi:A/G-specific adenine glycosylase